MKDLSQLVTSELNQRLKTDAIAMEKVSGFSGLKVDPFSFSFLPIEHFFPDTTVSVLKECFEVLKLNDLAEILAKVKPRALCPALSPSKWKNCNSVIFARKTTATWQLWSLMLAVKKTLQK